MDKIKREIKTLRRHRDNTNVNKSSWERNNNVSIKAFSPTSIFHMLVFPQTGMGLLIFLDSAWLS